MLIEIILFVFSIFILFVASLFDLKSREVPDTISYFFLFGVLGISAIYSVYNSFNFFLYTCLGAGIFFVVGYLLYLAKQMGGADVKILASLGGVFANFSLFNFSLAIIFFLLLLFIGALYTMTWGAVLYLKSFSHANKKAKELLQSQRAFRFAMVFISILVLVLLFFIDDPSIRILLTISALTLIILFYLTIFIRVVESLYFIKNIPISNLTEGDWLAKDVHVKNKLICSAKHPCLDNKQISLLKKAKVERVTIKVGIPFVPAIFLTTLTTFLFYFLL